ncbi:hypothetical protein B0T20DRAFT_395944 [Sordaria brevicollis]|uniref:2EXR domain-containing protein n=1 Tax=Sordaria brevicollis TaxID=83679 RepID=A0AAE0U6K8_SORBR|nr:hypothetical protein B0T20DRAFT_395944 [Sordaria brevicollis]
MTDHHKENNPEPGDKSHETPNQLHHAGLDNDQQLTAAVTRPHDIGARLLSLVTQQARAQKGRVTFWSLPREIRDMIWSEVLGPEDDIFQANITTWTQKRRVSTSSDSVSSDEAERLSSEDDQPRWTTETHESQSALLMSSRPPLPLAHLCRESRAFALQKYDSAYNKARRPGLTQERGPRFRWLSRSATRVLTMAIPSFYYSEQHYHYPTLKQGKMPFEEPLGENEFVVFRCWSPPPGYKGLRPGYLPTNIRPGGKLEALLEVLKNAKDYQIMLTIDEMAQWPFQVDQNLVRNWGIFDARTSGQEFAQDRRDPGSYNVFVPVQDKPAMVQLLRDLNRRGRMLDIKALGLSRHVRRGSGSGTRMVSRMHVLGPHLERPAAYFTEDGFRRLEDGEIFPNEDWWNTRKGRLREHEPDELLRMYVEHLERLWAENVEKHELASKSRYGRMPKLGFVYQFKINSSWAFQPTKLRNNR